MDFLCEEEESVNYDITRIEIPYIRRPYGRSVRSGVSERSRSPLRGTRIATPDKAFFVEKNLVQREIEIEQKEAGSLPKIKKLELVKVRSHTTITENHS